MKTFQEVMIRLPQKTLPALLCAVLFSGLLLPGCSKKKPQFTAMLEPGKSAVMVVFPSAEVVQAADWMAQVNLEGAADTKHLPRFPLADLKALLILNVQPGTYTVMGHAWTRKSPPSCGGTLQGVAVGAGELVVLEGAPLGSDGYPYSNTRLKVRERSRWELDSQNKLKDYMAGVLSKGTRN